MAPTVGCFGRSRKTEKNEKMLKSKNHRDSVDSPGDTGTWNSLKRLVKRKLSGSKDDFAAGPRGERQKSNGPLSPPPKSADFSSKTKASDFSSPPKSADFSSKTKTSDFSSKTKTSDFSSKTKASDFPQSPKPGNFSPKTKTSDISSPTKPADFPSTTKRDRLRKQLDEAQKELSASLKYLESVAEKHKLELVPGSATIILDQLLKLLIMLKDSAPKGSFSSFDEAYQSLISLLRWCDRPEKENSESAAADQIHKMITDLRLKVANLCDLRINMPKDINGNDFTDGGSFNPKTPPPKPVHPAQRKSRESKDYSPSNGTQNETDSGVFSLTSESLNSAATPELQLKPNIGDFHFNFANPDQSLDDLLKAMEKSAKKSVEKSPPETKIFSNEPEAELEAEPEPEVVETIEIINGRRVKRTQIRTRKVIKTTKNTTTYVTVGPDGKVTRKFEETGSRAQESEQEEAEEQLLKGPDGRVIATKNLRKAAAATASKYQTTWDPDSGPLPLPAPGGASGAETIESLPKRGEVVTNVQLMRQRAELAQSSKTILNSDGSVADQKIATRAKADRISAEKSAKFADGKLIDQTGRGVYEEKVMVHTTGEDQAKTSKSGALVSTSTPPQSPRKQSVANYVRILNGDQSEESEFVVPIDFGSEILAQYAILRDHLRLCEQAFKQQKISMDFGTGEAESSTIISLPFDYENLVDVRLPKSPNYKNSLAPKIPSLDYQKKPAILYENLLDKVDVSRHLMLYQTQRGQQIRGGPVDALLVFAAKPCAGQYDFLYQEAFLTTYRTFIPADEMVTKLIGRYHRFMQNSDPVEAKTARNAFSLLVRVVDELSPTELTESLINMLNEFTYDLISDGVLPLARLLRMKILERKQRKLDLEQKTSTPLRYSIDSRPLVLLDLKSDEIAEQLTFLDNENFQKIELQELLFWSQEQSEEKSPNLAAFTERFNKLSYWAKTRILCAESKDREKILWKFMKVMKNLRRMGNFNSFLSLLSALDSAMIRRLSWQKSPDEALRDFSTLIDSSQSFKNYRTALAATEPPCLPYIGLILQDLTFVHIGNSDMLPPEQAQNRYDCVNFAKRWQQFTILDNMRKLRRMPYQLQKDDEIIAYFGNFDDYLCEDRLWEISEAIKPRGGGRHGY